MAKTKKLTGWKRQLVDMVADETGCTIQHNGCPCNTCFHSTFCKDNQLGPELGHLFWLIVLAVRGDYTPAELIADIKENIATPAAVAPKKKTTKKK